MTPKVLPFTRKNLPPEDVCTKGAQLFGSAMENFVQLCATHDPDVAPHQCMVGITVAMSYCIQYAAAQLSSEGNARVLEDRMSALIRQHIVVARADEDFSFDTFAYDLAALVVKAHAHKITDDDIIGALNDVAEALTTGPQ